MGMHGRVATRPLCVRAVAPRPREDRLDSLVLLLSPPVYSQPNTAEVPEAPFEPKGMGAKHALTAPESSHKDEPNYSVTP